MEISQDAVTENEKQLRMRLKYLISIYDQPVLVEEFIVGREIIGILLEGYNKKVYLAEKVFHLRDEKYVLATFEGQWLKQDAETFRYRKYSDALLKEYVKRAFDITRMTDYGKFDVRLDSSGRYFFLDCNSNPADGCEVNANTDVGNCGGCGIVCSVPSGTPLMVRPVRVDSSISLASPKSVR